MVYKNTPYVLINVNQHTAIKTIQETSKREKALIAN